jgi:hypothetical protein
VVPPAFILFSALTGMPGSLTITPELGGPLREQPSESGLAIRFADTGEDFAIWLPASHQTAGL